MRCTSPASVWPIHLRQRLTMMCYDILPGGPADSAATVFSCITRAYAGHMCEQITNVSLGPLMDKQEPNKVYPCLKGRAQQIKDVLAILFVVWSSHMCDKTKAHRWVGELFVAVCQTQQLVSAHAYELFYRCR